MAGGGLWRIRVTECRRMAGSASAGPLTQCARQIRLIGSSHLLVVRHASCASPEQCWRSCCCHSLAERMAWAQVHGVRPPEYAIAEARRARIDLAWLVEPTGAGSKSLSASCCAARQLKAEATACCHAKKACCGHDHDQEP